jgi:hypothetical protein
MAESNVADRRQDQGRQLSLHLRHAPETVTWLFGIRFLT